MVSSSMFEHCWLCSGQDESVVPATTLTAVRFRFGRKKWGIQPTKISMALPRIAALEFRFILIVLMVVYFMIL